MGVSTNGGFDALMQKLIAGSFSAAYVVGEDLLASAAEPDQARAALQKLPFLVVQDTRMTETVKLAHVVLPATHFGEKEGTYTNRQGRLQKLNAALIAARGRAAGQRDIHAFVGSCRREKRLYDDGGDFRGVEP